MMVVLLEGHLVDCSDLMMVVKLAVLMAARMVVHSAGL